MKSLVKGFVTASSLTDKAKSKATEDLESCFKSDLTLPPPPSLPSDHQDQNMTIPEGT